ncbi:unannotated protein [freshwater metagenome]|uniref:Unannotated protein n=1 Tax=freshwater metagenome TaxID=449393 RepID=A0A6J5ZUQ6_9ZZZZ
MWALSTRQAPTYNFLQAFVEQRGDLDQGIPEFSVLEPDFFASDAHRCLRLFPFGKIRLATCLQSIAFLLTLPFREVALSRPLTFSRTALVLIEP